MFSTTRVAWIDAWEGDSTPSPLTFRTGTQRARDGERAHRQTHAPVRRGEDTRQDDNSSGHDSARFREARAIEDYDWEAAARRRPRHNECERVILHADRVVDARMTSVHYRGKEATARRPEPWPEARRRETSPRLRVVKQRVPRWRLGVVAGIFSVLLIGLTVIAPIMTSSAVAGLESALGQAEAEQQQLAAEAAALSSQISSLSSPRRVAEEAEQLGLAPANDVSYLATGDQMLASEGDTTVAGR